MLKFLRRKDNQNAIEQSRIKEKVEETEVVKIEIKEIEEEIIEEIEEIQGIEEIEEIESLVKSAPYIKDLLGQEIGLYISDKTHMIYAEHGDVKLNMKAGRKVTKGSVTDRALKEGNRVVARVAKEAFGIPYIGKGLPIKNKFGEVIGAIVTVTPITLQETLSSSANFLEETVGTVAEAINSLVTTSEEMSATSINLKNSAQVINKEIKKTDEVGLFITEVSERTHLLGLNAAIESARAGEAGKGFAIVANEIRQMSGETKDSVKEIKNNLKEMKNSIGVLAVEFERISEISQHQSASVQEISAAMQNLIELATELKQNSEKLIN